MDVVQRLRNEEAKLLQRLAAVRTLISEHEQLQARIEAALSKEGDYVEPSNAKATKYAASVSSKTESEGLPTESRARRALSADVQKFERIVTEILQGALAPMNRNEMFDAVSARGFSLTGATEVDQKNTLSSRLTRMSGVENVRLFGKRGYWLASRVKNLTSEH